MKNKPENIVNLDYGKLPPQAIDIEEAVLGALLLEKNAIYKVMDIINPGMFYKEEHQIICTAIFTLENHSKAIDILTVTEQLRKINELDEIGGPLYVTQLTNVVASSVHIKEHALIVRDKFLKREIIRIASEISGRGFDDSVNTEDLLDYFDKEISGLNFTKGKDAVSIKSAVKSAIDRMEEITKQKKEMTGIPTGINKLDKTVNGWQKSDYIVLAARPSMGKTGAALHFGKTAANNSYPTLIISMEMSLIQLTNRLIAAESGLEPRQLNAKIQNYMWEKIDNNIKCFDDMPLFIDDTPALTIFNLKSKIRRLIKKHNIELVILDYIQLMVSDLKGATRESVISDISRSLKALAKELDIALIVLSQLNRNIEYRSGSKRPMLADLRESGSIEQDADMVMFLHRPIKYGVIEEEDGTSMFVNKYNRIFERAELIIAKHRNGPTCDIDFIHNEEMTFFEDYSKEPF